MSMYDIGDVVRVRKGLSLGNDYGECDINEEMMDLQGTLLTIEYVDDDGDYLVKENPWSWHDDMLEPYVDEKTRLNKLYSFLEKYAEECCDEYDICCDCPYEDVPNCRLMIMLEYLDGTGHLR